jgi:hypothetical protein
MTRRRIIPYLFVIIIFPIIYGLTMIWGNLIMHNKIHLQDSIFVFGLTIVLVAVNIIEILTVDENSFLLRFIKSFLTILFVYIGGWFVYRLMGSPHVFNLYYFPRGAPAPTSCLVTIILTSFAVIFTGTLVGLLLHVVHKSTILQYIPLWLRMNTTVPPPPRH